MAVRGTQHQRPPRRLRGPERVRREVEALYGVMALRRLVRADGTRSSASDGDTPRGLEEIRDQLADLIARKTVSAEVERRVQELLQQRQQAFLQELRLEALRELGGGETPESERRLAALDRLERVHVARPVLERLRPRTLRQVVGQERAVRALLSRIAVPFPQHVILYGPPGVGKTTVARLVLEEAKRLPFTPFAPDAPFVEVDGAALRWDLHETIDPLLGSVRDLIYQGGQRGLIDSGLPEPRLGLVTRAHGGVLFIDEIGELDPLAQARILKVLEDRRVYFASSFYDPDDPALPAYVRRLFEQGAPADFVLIGATTRDPEEISPMVRSRCAEVYFDPLSPEHIRRIVRAAARRLGVELARDVPDLIGEYTAEGRKAVNLLADAYGVALHRRRGRHGRVRIGRADLLEVVRTSRLSPAVPPRGGEKLEVGRAFAVGVAHFVGSLIEVEAAAFPAARPGQGTIRFNETAGSMARDSVFNAAAVLRAVAGIDLCDFDLHVNVIGGGLIDGPSAGLAMVVAMMSAVQRRPIRQDVAMTGEVSIQGRVRQVGGIPEKLVGARQAGMRKVLVPAENAAEVGEPPRGLEVVPVATVQEALPHLFEARAARLSP